MRLKSSSIVRSRRGAFHHDRRAISGDANTAEAVELPETALPRSGTSMAMQMLQAGGVDILTDAIRPADHDNPRGYFEFELVKKLKSDTQWLDQAAGKAVKIIHLLLMDLPVDRLYKVIVLRRDLSQVVRSQSVMLERSGRKGAALAPERLMEIFATQLSTVMAWLPPWTQPFTAIKIRTRNSQIHQLLIQNSG
jgi:hypothetical protein